MNAKQQAILESMMPDAGGDWRGGWYDAAGGRQGFAPVVTTRNHGDPPTLSALGLTKRESAEAQMLAELPRRRIGGREERLEADYSRALSF